MQIGPVDLYNFEVPPCVRFGGNYRLSVHRLASGERFVEQLGPDDSEIQFEGVLSGPEAEIRARALDTLRLSGETVWLTWESFRYPVIVGLLTFRYRSPWWIEYRASCTVTVQPNVSALLTATAISLIFSDFGQAKSASANTGIALAGLGPVLALPNIMTSGSEDQMAALSMTAQYRTACMAEVAAQSAAVAAFASGDTRNGSAHDRLSPLVTAAGALASAACTQAYVGRIHRLLESSAS